LALQVAGVQQNPAALSQQSILLDFFEELLMGRAAISISSTTDLLLAPWQALVGFFAPWQNSSDCTTKARPEPAQPRSHAWQAATIAKAFRTAGEPALASASMHSVRRLRVLRVVDAASPPQSAGRMLISGRMADVCAELERMTQREMNFKDVLN
jgi:hypothetical protein